MTDADTTSGKVPEATPFDRSPGYDKYFDGVENAVQEIGMGEYQWTLFVIRGFGLFIDILWPVLTSIAFLNVCEEVSVEEHILELVLAVSLLVSTAIESVITGHSGLALFQFYFHVFGYYYFDPAGVSLIAVARSSFSIIWVTSVLKKLPGDPATFLDLVPASHKWLSTFHSFWWAWCFCPLLSFGLVLLPSFEGQGLKYSLYAMFGLKLTFSMLRLWFPLYESPNYLIKCGRDEEAIGVLNEVAAYNGLPTSLTLKQPQAEVKLPAEVLDGDVDVDVSAASVVKKGDRVQLLFATRKLAMPTSLLTILWAFTGLAFPLYNSFITKFLLTRGTNSFGDAHPNQIIPVVIGIASTLIAGWMAVFPVLGHRGTLSISAILAGVFLFASATADSSSTLFQWSCCYSFTSNFMYGVFYATSPSFFPSKDYNHGYSLVATGNRGFAIMAPFVVFYAHLQALVLIKVSGASFVAFTLILLLFTSRPVPTVTR